MESTDESKNLESEDIVAKYDEDPESSQTEEEQSGEQVYGYLYRSAGSEDATIYVDSRGFNLNGQSLIVTQNDDGNEIIVLVEDPDGQPLDQTFAHTVLQPDQVSFEEDLKEHGTLVVDEHSQGLEFIKSSEEEHEERHMYIENSGEILNISNENVDSPVDIESPLWSVANSGQLKNDGTEILFIPNPSVGLAPEETKHRKLMQLACIAHELQSADQKSTSTVNCDPEASVSEVTHCAEKDKCLPNSETEECRNYNGESTEVVSPGTSMHIVDNTVSVIHSTSSEIQSNALENQTNLSSPSIFYSGKSFPNSESEPPSEMLLSNVTTFHDNLDPSEQMEECSTEECLVENSQSSMIEVTEERCSNEHDNLALHNNDDSPLIFIEKSHKLNAENCSDANPDMKIDEEGQVNLSLLVIENDNPKSHDSNSNLSLMECSLSKKIDVSETTSLEDKENCSEPNAPDIDDDNLSSTEHSMSVSENETTLFLSSKYDTFHSKEKPSLENNLILLQDDKMETDNEELDLNDSNEKEIKIDEGENIKSDFEQSQTENLDSVLVIAEAVEDGEASTDVMDSIKSTEEDPKLSEDLTSKSTADVKEPDATNDPKDKLSDSEPNEAVIVDKVNSSPVRNTEESESVKEALSSFNKDDDERSSTEDSMPIEYPSVKRVSRTYISKKKMKKTTPENDTNVNCEKMELYTGDFNESDIVVEACLNSPKDSPSSHENNVEMFDCLETGVQSKVSAERTYSFPKEKCLYKKKKSVPPKQGLRSRSLRARSALSTLLLKNGNAEVSDSELKKKNCFDSSNSDNIPWGKVLLETSFEPCSQPNDTPSTSFAPHYSKETSTPLISQEQRLRKLNKFTRDFDRLLNSSPPIATKQPKVGKKHSSRMHPNVIRATKSKFSSSSRFSKSSSSLPLNTGLSKRTPSKKGQKPKEAKIKYLSQRTQPTVSLKKGEMYSCSSCNFSSVYVDNLMEHLKYCSNRQPLLDYEVNNMDKRQRIRGEEDLTNTVNNALKKIRSDLQSALLDEDPPLNFPGEEESESVRKQRSFYRQYGYGEDDVVWVRIKERYWPALVFGIDETAAYVKLISYPKEVKGLKVLHDHVRTFDNTKWNLMCLAEAETLPYNEIFVKAVQSCERFMSKKFLGVQVTGKEFFSVRDEVDFAVDATEAIGTEDIGSELEIVCSDPARKGRYETIDKQKLYAHIAEGNSDDYVLDIYYKRKQSKKNVIFFEKLAKENPEAKKQYDDDEDLLQQNTWFGPIEDFNKVKSRALSKVKPRAKINKEDLFTHFRELFLRKIGKKSFLVAYICQVWIPEAVVQALSVIKDIPLKDAELLFESEDSLDLDNEDPFVEDILKKLFEQ